MTNHDIHHVESRSNRAEIFECSGCAKRWHLPIGDSDDDAETRRYRSGIMDQHVCVPGVTADRVQAVRDYAEQMCLDLNPRWADPDSPDAGPLDDEQLEAMRSYEDAQHRRAESLAMEFDFEGALLSTAANAGMDAATPGEWVVWYAHSLVRHSERPDRERAMQLARAAIFPLPWATSDPMGINPSAFRPDHARLAIDLLGEARALRPPDDLPDDLPEPDSVDDATAAERLRDFEQRACSLV